MERMRNRSESDYVLKYPTSRNARWLDKEPVVFLFGWAGCKNRYLDKYAQLYSLQGCTTYQFTCPNDILFWHPERLQDLVQTMVDEFIESGHDEHPILFHVFSNGGCSVLARFLQYFGARPQLRGIIFDSSPALGNNRIRAQAFTEAAYGHCRPWVKSLLAGALSVVFTIWNCYRSLISWFRGTQSVDRWHPYTALSKMNLTCPMLFLYSKVDVLCKYQSIEAFIDKQRRRNVPVTPIRFEHSPHCQHGRTYPNEYNEFVKKFLYETVTEDVSGPAGLRPGDNDNGEDFVQLDGNEKPDDNDDFEIAE